MLVRTLHTLLNKYKILIPTILSFKSGEVLKNIVKELKNKSKKIENYEKNFDAVLLRIFGVQDLSSINFLHFLISLVPYFNTDLLGTLIFEFCLNNHMLTQDSE